MDDRPMSIAEIVQSRFDQADGVVTTAVIGFRVVNADEEERMVFVHSGSMLEAAGLLEYGAHRYKAAVYQGAAVGDE